MFHKASLKLAGLYLAIMMLISISFSVSLYHTSVRELDRNVRRQTNVFQSAIPGFGLRLPDNITTARDQELAEARHRIITSLIGTNVMILVLAGILSYGLARLTLKPIEEEHEAQNRFTADASHELRTPITAMRTETEVVLRDPNFDLKKAKALLHSNLEELDKLTGLTERLLSFARLEGATVKTTVKLQDTIDEAVQQTVPRAEEKRILLETVSDKDITVSGNHPSLVELFTILIDNAVKYSSEKTNVTITTKKHNKSVIIAVTDKGIGISQSDQAHIFERFYRADHSRSKIQAGGYGLGLSIAEKIVKDHNGSIEVSSEPEKGSTFTVSLPLL